MEMGEISRGFCKFTVLTLRDAALEIPKDIVVGGDHSPVFNTGVFGSFYYYNSYLVTQDHSEYLADSILPAPVSNNALISIL
jgi:hypothetical protein